MDTAKIRYFREGGIMATAFFLMAAVALAVMVGSGDYIMAFGLIVVYVGFGIGLLFGSKYYYLIPIGLSLSLPAIPIGGGRNLEISEAAILGCTLLAVLRFSMKHQKLRFVHWTFLGMILYVVWVMFILWQSPVGFSILGGITGGARFYLKILLGFAAAVILANQKIEEVDAKRILFAMLACTWVSAAWGIASYFGLTPGMFRAGQEVVVDTEAAYTWHQALAKPTLLTTMVVFALKKPSEVFSLRGKWLMLLLLFSIAIGMYSGKRAGIAGILIVPLMATIYYRQWKYSIFSGIGLIALGSVLVLGQGTWFSAPLTVQRSLSWIPADWDPEMQELGTRDIFRELLRGWATDEIVKDPLWGRKGFKINFSEIWATENALMSQEERTTLGHALSSNWHNTWLGTAADFGIPAAVFFAIFVLQWLTLSYKTSRRQPEGSYLHALMLVSFFMAVYFLANSHTSGHSSLNAYDYWWYYGLVIAVYWGLTARAAAKLPAAIKPPLAANSQNPRNAWRPLPPPAA